MSIDKVAGPRNDVDQEISANHYACIGSSVVEQGPLKPKVVGPIPTRCTKKPSRKTWGLFDTIFSYHPFTAKAASAAAT